MRAQGATILLVEDDDVDAEAVERAFRKAKIANPIVRAVDGVDALARLRDEGEAAVSRPFIILLDLNLPRLGGLAFLEQLRADPRLEDSIVFVLTTSSADRDKAAAYARNIAGYIVKSKAGEDFVSLIGMLDAYWRVVELPTDRSD